jgi:hypothetical protein
VLFAAFAVNPMAYINIGSVIFFMASFFIVRKTGFTAPAMVPMSIELIVRQVSAVDFLG